MEASFRWSAVTAIAPIAWGTNYYVTRHFLPAGYPLYGAALRALPAGLLLMAIVRTRPRGSWWWKSALLGTLNIGAFFVLVYLSAQLLPSSLAAPMMALSAGVMMLLGWAILSARAQPRSLLGAGLGVVGVAVMLLADVSQVDPWGVLAAFAAMLMSSVGFILTKRWQTDQSVLTVTAWQLVAGGVLLVPIAAIVEGSPPSIDARSALGFGYVTVVATALAYVAWFTGLRKLDAATVGLVGLLNPVAAVLLGTIVAAEPFGLRQLLGMAIVLAGMMIGRSRAGQSESRSSRYSSRTSWAISSCSSPSSANSSLPVRCPNASLALPTTTFSQVAGDSGTSSSSSAMP